MKEAIGGISLFQIVIVFLLLFTAIMCLTINHSKAFAVKDEIINIIETHSFSSSGRNYELSQNIIDEIVEKLNESGYRITGNCPSGSWIGYNRFTFEILCFRYKMVYIIRCSSTTTSDYSYSFF